jgi:hypothetical protein
MRQLLIEIQKLGADAGRNNQLLAEVQKLRTDIGANTRLLADVIAKANASAANTIVKGTADATSKAAFRAGQLRDATMIGA